MKALEDVLQLLELWMRLGNFEGVDKFMDSIDVANCEPVILIGILTMTFHAKQQLYQRDCFLSRTEAQLRLSLGDVRTEALLRHRR